jgi:hypothetical protein
MNADFAAAINHDSAAMWLQLLANMAWERAKVLE